MTRQLTLQGQVYRLEPPRPLNTKPNRLTGGRTLGLAGTAVLGLAAAGIVALIGHGDKDPGRAAVSAPAPKPAATARVAEAPPPAAAPKRVQVPPPQPAEQARVDTAAPSASAPRVVAVPPRDPAPPLEPSAQVAARVQDPARAVAPAAATPVPSGPDPATVARIPESAAVPAVAAVAPDLATTNADAPALPAPAPATRGPSAEDATDPAAASPAKAVVTAGADAPVDCLPAGLRSVLDAVAARFGAVTVVSTTHLHTDNHRPGSARAKMHQACKAVDFKVKADVKSVTAFLKQRREVNGINAYRNNGVVHIDANERFAGQAGESEPVVARSTRRVSRVRSRSRRARAGRAVSETGTVAGAAPAAR